MSLDEVAYGFIKVANETMARPIRSLTEARGFSTAKHALACEYFKIACLAYLHRAPLFDVKLTLISIDSFRWSWRTTCMRDCSIPRYHDRPHPPFFVHPLCLRTCSRRSVRPVSPSPCVRSTLTSTLRYRAHEIQEPCAETWSSTTKGYFVSRIEKLKKEVVAELKAQGFAEDMIETECYLNMR